MSTLNAVNCFALKLINSKLILIVFLLNLSYLQCFLLKPKNCLTPDNWFVNTSNNQTINLSNKNQIDLQNSTANQIISPMLNFKGNIILVSLQDASHQLAQHQSNQLERIYDNLIGIGIKQIVFIIINTKQSNQHFNKLQNFNQNASFVFYQDTYEANVWQLLDGKNGDFFIFDRCGRLTYHLINSLKKVTFDDPIIQAAILSTNYDNVCNNVHLLKGQESCNYSNKSLPFEQNSIYPNRTTRDENVNANETVLEETDLNLNNTKFLNQTKHEIKSLNETFLIENQMVNFSIKDLIENKKLDSSIKEPGNSSIPISLAWQIFKYFLSNIHANSKSDEDHKTIEEHQQNLTIQMASSLIQNKTNLPDSASNDSNLENLPLTTTIDPHLHPLDLESNQKAKCIHLKELNCNEFSVDKMLTVRLCCLNSNVLNSSKRFGCRNFNRSKCDRMLSIIKCCLKDFSQLLEEYFRNHKNERT